MTAITRDQALKRLCAVLIDVDAAVALARAMESYAVTCEEHYWTIEPTVMKTYATRIAEGLCASEEQDDA